jgi:hypothetical protein
LEDGGGAAALGGGIGRQLKIAAAMLGSRGGRRTCNKGISIDIGSGIIKAKGLLLQRQHQSWQGRQQRTRPMQATYVNGDGKEIGVSQRWWWWCGCKDVAYKARARGQWHDTRQAQVRRGQCNNGVAKEMMGERENG